ncbi:MAG TPA: hypothetical protein VGB24_15780 [Longimicrobium sp.]|jgi:hypothetical protein|uniref:hypothetical protein n=1 Tax=Longimicrobium sp. TaxID=2029185 RepID=UPI002ED87B29
MTPPAVSAPPRPAAHPAGAPAPGPAVRARAPFTRRRPERPPLFTGRTLGISLVLHALLAVGVLLLPERGDRTPAFTTGEEERTLELVEYLDVGAWGSMATPGELPPASAGAAVSADAVIGAGAADSALARLPNPVAFPNAVPSGIPRALPGTAGAGGGTVGGSAPGSTGGQTGGAGQGTGAGRRGLSPEYGDPRLAVTPQAIPERKLTDEERYRRHLESRINGLNDSIAGEAAYQRGLLDWTFRDAQGRRWGIDNGRAVIGGRSVPLPRPASPPRDRDEEQRTERDQRREMDRQEEDVSRERHLRERGRAIRERENERRRQQREGQTTP